MTNARLTRSDEQKIFAGICGGLAEYVDIDPVFVRLAFLVLLFASGIGLPIYIILMIIMPSKETVGEESSVVLQKNLDEIGSGVSKIGRSSAGGTVLILLGGYFLLQQFGLLSGLISTAFWPLLSIGVGGYLITRSRS